MKFVKSKSNYFMNLFILGILIAGFFSTLNENAFSNNIAIKGYDTVAYFNSGKAAKGSGQWTFQWHNMTWLFLGKENRDIFASNPEKYAPQYDGYCAWAMTEARKAVTDPEVWKIVDGKLYLNCSKSAYEKWNRDIPGNIKKADANWLKIFLKYKN